MCGGSDVKLTSHPNFVMESDGEIHVWTAEDTARVEEAVRRAAWSTTTAQRAHAHVMWISNVGDS